MSPAINKCYSPSFPTHKAEFWRELKARDKDKNHCGVPVSSVGTESEGSGSKSATGTQKGLAELRVHVAATLAAGSPSPLVHSQPRTSSQLTLQVCLSPSRDPRLGRDPLHGWIPAHREEAGELCPTEPQGAQSPQEPMCRTEIIHRAHGPQAPHPQRPAFNHLT